MLILLSSFFISQFFVPAYAGHFFLYSKGVAISNYEATVNLLSAGDVIRFTNGKEFTIVQRLEGGSTDAIFEIEGGQVIRMDADQDRERIYPPHLKFYRTFHTLGLKTVKVYPERSVPYEYVIVDKENIRFTLAEWVHGKIQLTPEDSEHLKSRFEEFAKSTSHLTYLGDFWPKNIGWNGRDWILIDWGTEMTLANPKSLLPEKTIFHAWHDSDYPAEMRGAYQERIIQQILLERKKSASGQLAECGEKIPPILDLPEWATRTGHEPIFGL